MNRKPILYAAILLLLASCPDPLSQIATDYLAPPRSMWGDYRLISSSEPDMTGRDSEIYRITEDDYQKIVEGKVWFSLKEWLIDGDIVLSGQEISTDRWILHFPDETMTFEITENGIIICDRYKGYEIIYRYERIR